MVFSVLDAWDRVAEARSRVRAAWTVWAVGAVFVLVWVVFLVLESMWETMTTRRTPAMDEHAAPSPRR
ncbi:hypothetical protein [Microbacterium candidum]|uniref:Uncharacterized protein n=1 Tax=Microbacterium candidum TaxID=3041922 RepID=A0ABT7N217_9MICO|nr:hypothetical protein [Microbacterium sp. ASV49]MDL9980755.1 hypothetical protein [Microbacterium sp. ASV49]